MVYLRRDSGWRMNHAIFVQNKEWESSGFSDSEFRRTWESLRFCATGGQQFKLRWGSGNLDRCHPAQFARFRSARGSIPFRSTFIFGVLFPV